MSSRKKDMGWLKFVVTETGSKIRLPMAQKLIVQLKKKPS
jgi:hypothetical protein